MFDELSIFAQATEEIPLPYTFCADAAIDSEFGPTREAVTFVSPAPRGGPQPAMAAAQGKRKTCVLSAAPVSPTTGAAIEKTLQEA